MCSCLCPADDAPFDTFTEITTFSAVPIGGEFIEGLTPVNEVAVRIEPTIHRCKPVNTRRSGGKLVLMVDWEPVFIRGEHASQH